MELQTFITTSICTIVATIIGVTFKHYLNRTIKRFDDYVEEAKKTAKANNNGTRVMLKKQLEDLFLKCQNQGYATLDDTQDALDIYEPYHEMGGNGRGTKFYNQILNLPIKEDK